MLIYPDPPPIDAARVVDFMGARWKAIGNDVDVLNLRPTQDHDEGAPLFDIATISLEGDPVAAKAVLEAIRRKAGVAATVIVLVRGNQLQDLDDVTHLFDDFCVTPFHPAELEARIRTCLRRGATIAQPHVDTIEALLSSNETLLTYEDLVLNLETYQAQVDSRSLDLTYMEYELLRSYPQIAGKIGRGARTPHTDGSLGGVSIWRIPLVGRLAATRERSYRQTFSPADELNGLDREPTGPGPIGYTAKLNG